MSRLFQLIYQIETHLRCLRLLETDVSEIEDPLAGEGMPSEETETESPPEP